jgi:hypothetical protein
LTRLRPDIPKLPFGATERAHLKILAQRAESVQPMVGSFFQTRNPCKHWPNSVPGAFLSSMFPDKRPQNHAFPRGKPASQGIDAMAVLTSSET